MKSVQVEASQTSAMQKDDDDSYPSDTIVEQAGNQHALLKNRKSMDKKEDDISGDASEEDHQSPETTAEIKACLPEAGIIITAPSMSSVDDTQHTHDDIKHQIPSAEKEMNFTQGDMESTLPEEQEADIMQTSVHECSFITVGDSIDDSEVIDVKHENNQSNAEVSPISGMLLKPDIKETAEYGRDEMENENFSKQILPPIEEKSIEQPFYDESREVGNIIAQLKAEGDSSIKTAEIQVQHTHIPLTADQEGKSPQDLNYEKELDNKGMSPEDVQQISEKISESRDVSCADEEAEPTSEPQQSYQEILEPRQIICERANDSKENANDNSTEREITTSREEMLVDSSSTIEDCSKKIESEIHESKIISSEDGAYSDQLGGCATIEAMERSSQVGLAAETGPVNRQKNDEHQTCQTEVEENETISEMIKQNRSFPESDSQEKNVITTESISYDNANMANTVLEGDTDKRDELKAEETGYGFIEENVETATREPYSSDQISSTDENSIQLSEKGDSAISNDSDKTTSLNDDGNMESVGTEAKLDMMQEAESNQGIVVGKTVFDHISEEIIDESDKHVDSLTVERNKITDEPSLIVDSRQHIPLPEENQLMKLTDVRETAYDAVGEENSIEEENDSIRSPDKDTEKDYESNNEEIQNDSKPDESCRNEQGIVKHLEIVNPKIEATKLERGVQNQENSIHHDAMGADGDAQAPFTNAVPTSPENHEIKIDERMEETVFEIEQNNSIEKVELSSIRDVTSAEENLEDSTNSAVGENNVTSEASIYKRDDQNENQSLSVTGAPTGTEAEDTINKTDDSEKEVDLQHTEETQSTRNATAESFQCATTDEIEDHKTFESANSDPSQQHDETNTNSNYNEDSDECKEQVPNELTDFRLLEGGSNTEEAKDQVNEEGSSSNKEGIRRTDEVSQSQDECNKVHEDSIHVIEVEETTDKQHEEQDDRSLYNEHDGVLADQVKALDAGMDAQKENELNISNSDGVHVQEDRTVREPCKYDGMDESDTRKDPEIISQEFEQDKLVNKITSQKSSPHIEPLEHNLGTEMNDPTAGMPSETVNDEARTVEASKAAELEVEQHIQTNEDPEQENYISANKEFQEMNVNPWELSENTGTESDNIEVQDDGLDDEEGVCDDTAKTVLVTDPKIEGDLSTGIPSQSGKLDSEISTHNPVTSRDKGTRESSEAMQVLDIHEEVSADCRVSSKEVILMDPSTDLPQENERNTASLDYKQVQEDQRGHEFFKNSEIDESHPEKDKELIDQGFEQDSISSEMPCQRTSAAIEALRQDIGNAMDDHTQNEPSEIANDKAHFEREQRNQTNKEPENENEIPTEEGMDVENHEFIPESAELTEANNIKNEAINSRAADLGSNNVEDFSGNENTNSEISQKVTTLDKDPRVNTEVVNQDIRVENRELVPPSAELTEENHTENEAINNRAEDLGSNTVEDSGNENTNLGISLKEIGLIENPIVNTEVVLQGMDVQNHKIIPESTELREENNTENEAINSRAADRDANTIEDLSGNENTNLEILQKVAKLEEDPRVNTEVIPQDMSVENRELVPEPAELAEENNIENEASNSIAEDLASNNAENSGNGDRSLEISQKKVNTEVVLPDMDIENHELILESTELREENNTENEAINSRAVDLGSSTLEDLSGNENTNSEISEKVTNLDEDPRVSTEVIPQDKSVENHELVSKSAELAEESNTENEAFSSRAVNLGSNTVKDLSGNENTNSEISQKVASLDKDPRVNTEIMPRDMSVENSELVLESAELTEENNTENETINSKSEDLGSKTVEDSGTENTNLEISQTEISLNGNPVENREVVLQVMDIENHELIAEITELREENNTENEAIKSRREDLGSNTVEDLTGYENTNSEIPQKEINSDEDPTVNTEIVPQDIEVENHELISESTELREENNTEKEAINIRAEGDLSGSENKNSEMSQEVTNLDGDLRLNTEVMPQDMSVENHGFNSESTQVREENKTDNEAVNSIAKALGSNTIEDVSGNKNSNSDISQKEINLDEDPAVDTEVVVQDMSIESRALVQESAKLSEENNTESEAINSRADDLGSNTVEDSGNENTNLETSQKDISLNENPIVNTDGVIQDMGVENHELIPESTELREETSTENEAIRCRAVDLGSNTVEDLSGNENTNSEISQKLTNLDEENNTEVMPQVMDFENLKFIPESTDIRKADNIENEAIYSRGEELGSNTIEDLTENENTNLEISQREINLDEDRTVNTEIVPLDMDIEDHDLIPQSTELKEENNTDNEAINSRAVDLGSNPAEDLSGKENTNSDEDPRVDTEVVPQDMGIENHSFIPESTELREDNNIENKAVKSIAGALGSNTVEDLSGNKNRNLEISQKDINLDEDPIADRKVVLQDMDVENLKIIPETTELRKEDNIENKGVNSRAEDLGSTTVEDFSGKENTNLEISQKEISLNEDPIVDREVVRKDMDVENHKFIPESTELIEENNTKDEGINSKALGPNTAGDLGGNENTNSEIFQQEMNLVEIPVVEVEMLQAMEKIQVDEEPGNTERESTQEGSHQTLTKEHTIDQEKHIDTADAPHLETEVKACMNDEEIQEVKETHELCMVNEMNESVSSNNKECESHGFEDDCTSIQEQNEQTPLHSEAFGQNEEAEVPNQDTEECRIDASEVNNTEVAEHDEHRNEALVDKINEQEVICTNVSSSGNEMDTSSSEVKSDDTLLLAETITEPPPGISQTNNADQGPELGVREQSIEGNEEEDELDPNEPKFNMEMVVDSIEESQHKDNREGIPLDQEDLNHFASQDYEINRQPTVTQSGNGILTTIEPSQYIQEWEPNNAEQEENISHVTNSNINGHDIDEMTADETVQTQGKQPVEPPENFLEPSSPSEATSTTQDKEDCLVTLQDLNKEKEEDPMPEKATQRELQVSSGFELSGDLPYIPAVEKVSKTEEYSVTETQGANDPLVDDKMEPQSCTNSYSHETEREADQFQHKSQQTFRTSLTDDPSIRPISEKYGHMSEGIAENQEETKSPEQLIEPNNEEQTIDYIIEGRGHQAVKSENTVEESTVEENYESQGTPAYNTIEEKKEISIETKPLEEVDNMEDDTQSSRVVELKGEDAYEIRGCEGDTVTNEETVFHGHGMRNSSHGNQGIDTNVEDENSVPIKDNYIKTSADEVMVAEDEHHVNTQSERTSITTDAATSEEVPAGSVEIVERSSEPVPFKESKKVEDEIMEEKEETNADGESHEPEFYKIDNDADRDEKTLNSTECNTKSEDCFITISKDSKEISKEPNILVTSTSLEGEAVGKNFQQNKSGERTENEVRHVEPKMDASELLHQMNVPKPDNMDIEREKQQQSAKGLECCSTLEPQQESDRIWFTEMEVPEDVSSKEIDSGHSDAKLKLDEIPSEGKFTNASGVHMDCQEAGKISTADIIASHICQEIETEDKLKQPSSEHQKQKPETSTLVTDVHDRIFKEEVLRDESTENTFMSFDNPSEIICAPKDREIEPPNLEAEPKALSSEFQGVETSAEVKNDTEDSTVEILNVKEDCHLNEKRETDQSSQLSFKSQPISGENLVNSCETSTDNHTKTESFEPVIELESEKLAITEETGNDTQLQTVRNEILGESSPSNIEVYEAVVTNAAEEEETRDVNTTVSSKECALVQPPLPTTKSSDETEKPLIADEHSANTTFSVSQVSGINETPSTQKNASEEKISEQQPLKKVSNQDSNITQTVQADKEEQLQRNYDDIPQPSQLQDLYGKDSVNMTDELVDTVDAIYSGINVEGFTKEGSESNTNEVPSLKPMQSLTTNKEEITAEKHNETEAKSMPQSTIGNKKEEWVVGTKNPQDDEKRAADEPKTETGKEDAGDDLGEEDSELKPMISEASRDIKLKTQNKKSHHILSGMGSKMKISISKVKKAMACTSPQFSPDNVIIKLNKSKKS